MPVGAGWVELEYAAGPGNPAPGNVRRKQPPAGIGTSSNRPRCAVAMPSDNDSPRPLPTVEPFVVKNGSKILPAIAGGTPGPGPRSPTPPPRPRSGVGPTGFRGPR